MLHAHAARVRRALAIPLTVLVALVLTVAALVYQAPSAGAHGCSHDDHWAYVGHWDFWDYAGTSYYFDGYGWVHYHHWYGYHPTFVEHLHDCAYYV